MSLKRITVLVSGRGSNLVALLDAERAGAFAGSVTHVISNRPDALALAIARRHGAPTEVVDHRAFPTREAFDRALVVAPEHEARATRLLAAAGEKVARIGTIVPRPDGAPAAVVA